MAFWLTDDNMASFEYARTLTAHHAKSFYLSAKLLPPERRWATYALYGFCRYADNLVDTLRTRTQQEIVQEVDGLDEEVQIAYRTGESEHPVVKPFIVVAGRYGIPSEYPLELLNGVRMDVQRTRYQDFDALYLFCYRMAGVVGLMMTHVLGYRDRGAFQYAEKLGVAMQLTNILRDIKEDKDMGRIYLPQEELRGFGVRETDILDEHMAPPLRRLMEFQVERADRYYEEADPGIRLLSTDAQFAIRSASRIYRGILRRIEAQQHNPFAGRAFVSQRRKMAILSGEAVRTRFLWLKEHLRPSHYMMATE